MSDCYILRVLKEGFCSQLMATKECFSYFYNVSVRYLEIFPGYLNFREDETTDIHCYSTISLQSC